MASHSMSYDDPNYKLIRTHLATGQAAATGVQSALAFRSRVAAVVQLMQTRLSSLQTYAVPSNRTPIASHLVQCAYP